MRYERESAVLGSVLVDQARTVADRPYLFFGNQAYTFAETNRRANRVANGLRSLGVVHGEPVCFMLPNHPDTLFAWFGINKAGAIEVPVNTSFRGAGLAYAINDVGARRLLIHRDLLGTLKAVERDLRTLEEVVIWDPSGREDDPTGLRFRTCAHQQLTDASEREPEVSVRYTDLSAILHTSGTTGPSKGVMLSHHHQIFFAQMIARQMGYRLGGEVVYSCLPYYHNTAQAMTALPALVTGNSIALAERFSASRFWDDVRKHACTAFIYSGSVLSMLMKQPPRPDDRAHPARVGLGVPLLASVHRGFEERFGVTLLTGFGSTEIQVPVYSSPEGHRPGACGKVVGEYWEMRIADENDEEVATGQVGEILFRPRVPHTMLAGYWGKPEETVRAFRNLWWHQGDVGYIDADGDLYFVDRKKDVIRRRGENISSFELEAMLNTHAAVLESAAFGVPSDLGEEDVKMVVVFKPGQRASFDELAVFLSERVARFAVPRYFEAREVLPKTPSERIEKHLLKADGVTAATWDRERRD